MKSKIKCLKCENSFTPRHKYHVFCSKTCKFRNYFSKDRQDTMKLYAPVRVKKESLHFDWKDYPYGV